MEKDHIVMIDTVFLRLHLQSIPSIDQLIRTGCIGCCFIKSSGTA